MKRYRSSEQPFKPKWWLLTNGCYYVNINKNASTSIKQHRVDHRYRKPKGKKIAVIRNPYDRLVSCWEDRKQDFGDKGWDEFIGHVCETSDEVINSHARSQYLHLDPWPDILIPFEKVNEQFASLGIELKHANKSVRKPWESYYTKEQLKRVRKRYAEDFKLWESLK